MSFGAMAALMIFLHMAPNLAGASWSVYKEHGLVIDRHLPHAKAPRHHR
jgi:hypothetical protein